MFILLLRMLSLTYAKERASKLGSAAALNPWIWDQAASSLSFSAPSWAGTQKHLGHARDLRICICFTQPQQSHGLCASPPASKSFKGTPRDHVKKSSYSRHFLSSAIRKFIIICRIQQVKKVKSCKARAEAVSGEVSKRNVLLWNEVWVNRSVETELLRQEETHFMQRH